MGNTNLREFPVPSCIGGVLQKLDREKGAFEQVSTGDSASMKSTSKYTPLLEFETMYKNVGPDYIEDQHGKIHKEDEMLIILIEWAIIKIEYTIKTIHEDTTSMKHKFDKYIATANERKTKTNIAFPKVPSRPPGSKAEDTVGLISDTETSVTNEGLTSTNGFLRKNDGRSYMKDMDIINDRRKELLHEILQPYSSMLVALSHLKTEIQLCKLEKALNGQRFIDFRKSIDDACHVNNNLHNKEYVAILSENLISLIKTIENRPTS